MNYKNSSLVSRQSIRHAPTAGPSLRGRNKRLKAGRESGASICFSFAVYRKVKTAPPEGSAVFVFKAGISASQQIIWL